MWRPKRKTRAEPTVPERVANGTRIDKEHPEWITRDKSSHLFKLHLPEARAWLTDYIDRTISETNLEWVRWDFNMEPLEYWRKNDAPDRQGMTEIRHVEGLYAMWEELMRRHPGLLIDICASGGRRIDFETLRYGLPLWHSDRQCFGPNPAADQLQNAGLFRWLPMHGCGNFGYEPDYLFRSGMTSGNILCGGNNAGGETEDAVKRSVALYKKLRPYMLGDFYPIFPHSAEETSWFGYQFHRPDLDAGYAVVFRRPQAAQAEMTCAIQGPNPGKRYQVTFEDSQDVCMLTGEELARLRVSIPATPGSAIVYYQGQ